eukprot:CAMPEP_0205831128 /NCGR_PEP_ID=MMETSP0206-20130828/43149_1 /ASSEMBLY_ACC=CAM_ASM_000279 /TAXON_ID=36767 /ORGANISM="Euplotes focardii, Strain TN1" /LENGTH=359 /DNA_ID=CAMNT_0053135459 /DNA_START=307 /DNA_END=1386 /DNA_ORIENTATION=+
MTMGELRYLTRATEASFEKASSGELQTIVESERTLRAKTEKLITNIENALEDAEQKVKAYEKKTTALLSQSGISSSTSTVDYIPGFGRDGFTIAITDITAALEQDPSNQKAQELAGRFYAIADAKHEIEHIKLCLVNCWNEHHENHAYDKVNFEDISISHNNAKQVLNSIPTSWTISETTFGDSLTNLSNKEVEEYFSATSEYEKVFSSKESFFSEFVHDEIYDQTPLKIKDSLIAYLSSNIVVKEHRLRYQSEQYERYQTLMRFLPVDDNMTLQQFSIVYAEHLRREVELSYMYISPKIQANYDDFQERSVKPINAAVFYYFFNANRTRRKMAQVILSAARYPNEKVRRAYLRFFSNA